MEDILLEDIFTEESELYSTAETYSTLGYDYTDNLVEIHGTLIEILDYISIVVWLGFILIVYGVTRFIYKNIIMKIVGSSLKMRL